MLFDTILLDEQVAQCLIAARCNAFSHDAFLYEVLSFGVFSLEEQLTRACDDLLRARW